MKITCLLQQISLNYNSKQIIVIIKTIIIIRNCDTPVPLNKLIICPVFVVSLSVMAWLFSRQNWVFNVLPWLTFFPIALMAGFAADAAIKKGRFYPIKLIDLVKLQLPLQVWWSMFHPIFYSISFDYIFLAGFSVTFVRKFFQVSLNEILWYFTSEVDMATFSVHTNSVSHDIIR